MSMTDYVGRLGRQAMLLQEYTFTIKYIPGEDNHVADFASRPNKLVLAVATRSTTEKLIEDEKHFDLSFKNLDIYKNVPSQNK